MEIGDPQTIGWVNVALSVLLTAPLPTGEPDFAMRGWGLELFSRVYAIEDHAAALDQLGRTFQQQFRHRERQRLLEEAERSRQRVRELFLARKIPRRYVPNGVLTAADIEAYGLGEAEVKPFVPVATEASRRQRARSA